MNAQLDWQSVGLTPIGPVWVATPAGLESMQSGARHLGALLRGMGESFHFYNPGPAYGLVGVFPFPSTYPHVAGYPTLFAGVPALQEFFNLSPYMEHNRHRAGSKLQCFSASTLRAPYDGGYRVSRYLPLIVRNDLACAWYLASRLTERELGKELMPASHVALLRERINMEGRSLDDEALMFLARPIVELVEQNAIIFKEEITDEA